MTDLTVRDLRSFGELWREYDFGGRVYRIDRPLSLWVGTTTHRVLDGTGVVHLLPAPGVAGCVVRWKKEPGREPVDF